MTSTHPVAEISEDGHDRSTAQLVRDVSQQTSHLMRAEAKLAVREVTAKAKRGAVGGGLLGAAAATAFFGAAALLAAVIMVIALGLPGWAAALITGGALVIIAALLGAVGGVMMRKASPPMPGDTITSVKTDVDSVKESAHR